MRCSIDFLKFFKEKHRPENWTGEAVLDGKLYRYVDTGITLPLIEISESDLSKLDGYEFYEPYWVVAQPPTIFAVYDRHENMIYSSFGFVSDYSLDALVQADGYESAADFRERFKATTQNPPFNDLDIWIRMGLPAKVYLPSLKKRGENAE